jgi:hypothetical protein
VSGVVRPRAAAARAGALLLGSRLRCPAPPNGSPFSHSLLPPLLPFNPPPPPPPPDATGYPVAMTGDGKGFFPEDHDQYVGEWFDASCSCLMFVGGGVGVGWGWGGVGVGVGRADEGFSPEDHDPYVGESR